jgi:hypothetical protein
MDRGTRLPPGEMHVEHVRPLACRDLRGLSAIGGAQMSLGALRLVGAGGSPMSSFLRWASEAPVLLLGATKEEPLDDLLSLETR